MIRFSRSILPSFCFSTFFSGNITPSFCVEHLKDSELIDKIISDIIDTEMTLSDFACPSETSIKIIYDKKDVINENIPPLMEYLPIISIENTMFQHFLSIKKPYHKIELNREIKKLLEFEYLKSGDKQTKKNDLGTINIEVIDEKEYLFY